MYTRTSHPKKEKKLKKLNMPHGTKFEHEGKQYFVFQAADIGDNKILVRVCDLSEIENPPETGRNIVTKSFNFFDLTFLN